MPSGVTMSADCTCDECVGACTIEPGWFAPGQAEEAASLLNLDFEKFKKKYLIIDYWEQDELAPDDIYLYTPRKIGAEVEDEGAVASYWYHETWAPCVFLKDSRCLIHETKPKECRMVRHDRTHKIRPRERIMKLWRRAGNPLSSMAQSELT